MKKLNEERRTKSRTTTLHTPPSLLRNEASIGTWEVTKGKRIVLLENTRRCCSRVLIYYGYSVRILGPCHGHQSVGLSIFSTKIMKPTCKRYHFSFRIPCTVRSVANYIKWKYFKVHMLIQQNYRFKRWTASNNKKQERVFQPRYLKITLYYI